MKIAVASQNRHQITEHAGRCRKFWIYEISHDAVTRKELLELPKEQSYSGPQFSDNHLRW
jgi:predicted Fe-Mo cluster-binding NifX family protein